MTAAPPTVPNVTGTPVPRPSGWRTDGVGYTLIAWTVTFVSAIVAAGVVAFIFVILAVVDGERDTTALSQAAQSVPALWTTVLVTQAVMLGGALLACRLVTPQMRQRLGLVSTGLGWGKSAMLVVSTIIPFGVGLLAAAGVHWILPHATESGMTRMWSDGSRTTSVLWVLCIGALPGFIEEIFYRGFLLRGLLLRWRPRTAILVSSAAFGISHIEPGHAVFTFIIGVWFGLVAWRTGSVLLPIIMHAGMNGSWTALQMIGARSTAVQAALAEPAFTPEWISIGAVLAIGLIAFVVSLRVLGQPRPETSEPPTPLRARTALLALAVCATLAVPLYAVIPPGREPSSWSSASSIYDSLHAKVTSFAVCPSDGPVQLSLMPGQVGRVALPVNRVGVSEVLVSLDEHSTSVWLAYSGEATGKGTSDGIPQTGIIEEIDSNDPTVVQLLLTRDEFGITVRFSLLQDKAAIDRAWERADSEPGWSKRRRSPATDR